MVPLEAVVSRFCRWLVLLLSIAFALPAFAADERASNWAVTEQGQVRLVSAVMAVGNADVVQLGVEFAPKEGWKIYWRTPGDAGYPPSINWQGSDNLADAELFWPAPQRFSISGLETIGYEEPVILPVTARLNDAGKPLVVKAAIDYLTCNVICVPKHVDLALTIPEGAADASANSYAISRFLAHVPGEGSRHGLTLQDVRMGRDGSLRVTVDATMAFHHPDLFVEQQGQLAFGKPAVRLENGKRRVTFVIPVSNQQDPEDLRSKPVTLTLVDGDRSMEVVSDVAPPEPRLGAGDLVGMLAIALLGGLILNVMPCVLPVLSLKILSVIQQGGRDDRHVRASFLASAAGILASFWVLAVATLVLKTAGAAVGWGIQFQQPVFLVVMILLLLLFSANLFGLFEIRLPSQLSDWAASHGNQNNLLGHFAAGAFATLLATPCSAPFLGTAIGFALAHGAIEILSIFTWLGIGMSLPYLLLAAWPRLAAGLPKPGRWMVTMRRLLGVVLLGTAVWLGIVLATIFAPVGNGDLSAAQAKGLWSPFNRDQIASEVAAGKVVFVDVTAEWCITCQVNKATVVYRGAVAKRLAGPNIVAMQADWTKPDDDIAAYLGSFGRYGIPFDAVYGPGAPDGIALPELLTSDDVLDALNKASMPPK